ncbi:MAG TPA: tetratricopeptide repeat protein [Terriglobales bacterium]
MASLTLIWLAMLAAPSFGQDATTARLRHAAQFISAGNLDRAADELQLVLRAAPQEYRALDLLGVVRILQHREGDAAPLFQQSIQSKPDFASAHAHLGLLYLQSGRENEAVPELQEAIRIDPTRTDASDALVHFFRQRAQAAGSSGNWQQALGLLIEARRLSPKSPDVQYEFGMAALKMSLPQDAIDAFRETLSQRKDDPLAIYALGRAYGSLGRFDDARQQFARYITLRADDPAGYCSLGMTLMAREQMDEARTQFERSIAIAPEQTEAYFRLGMLELHANNWESARLNLQHVLDRDPGHAGALSALGRVEFEQKRYLHAAELLKRAITRDDSIQEAHYYLGLTYARTGQKSESEEEFQRATELEHEDVEKRRAVWNRLDFPPALDPQLQRR